MSETRAPSRPMSETKAPSSRNMADKPVKIRGVVTWYSDAKGMGFISVKDAAAENGEKSFFVSFHDVADPPVMINGKLRKVLYKDDTVEFYESYLNQVVVDGVEIEKPAAKNVRTVVKSTEKFQGFTEDFFK